MTMNTFCLSPLRSFAVLIAWRSAASGNRDEVGTSIALDSNSMLNPSWFPMISSQAYVGQARKFLQQSTRQFSRSFCSRLASAVLGGKEEML